MKTQRVAAIKLAINGKNAHGTNMNCVDLNMYAESSGEDSVECSIHSLIYSAVFQMTMIPEKNPKASPRHIAKKNSIDSFLMIKV